MPTVKILAEAGGAGYWLADADARDIGDLPVPASLRDSLFAWNTRFERECDAAAYEDPTGMRFDFLGFARDGLALAKSVKRALPHWTVIYWDEGADWRLSREYRRWDRTLVEYEVTLEMTRVTGI